MKDNKSGKCPSCGHKLLIDTEFCSGMWDGPESKGPMYKATCPGCGKKLVAYEANRKDIQASDIGWQIDEKTKRN